MVGATGRGADRLAADVPVRAGPRGRYVTVVTAAYGLFALLALAFLSWELRQIDAQFESVARGRGQDLFYLVQLTRDWNAEHGGVYVPASEHTPPNPYLDDRRRDVTTVDGQKLTKVNPAYMTRQMSELAEKSQGIKFHITSLRPIRPANAPDAWEREALEMFEAGVKERISFLDAFDSPVHRFMAPLAVKQACMNCHAKQGYQVGDIRGGISITMPARGLIEIRDQQRLRVKTFAILTFMVIAGLAHVLLARGRAHYRRLHDLTLAQERTIVERTRDLSDANASLSLEVQERQRQQELLAESEERYRSVVESVQDGIIVVDDLRILFVNQALSRMLGHRSEDMVGRDMREFVSQEELEKLVSCREACINGAPVLRPLRLALLHRQPGRIRSCELQVFPLRGGAGTMGRSVLVVKDVTERLEAERELEVAAVVFNHAAEAIMVTDENNRIVRVNPAFTAITGYTPAEALGRDPGFLGSGRHDKEFFRAMRAELDERGHWAGEIWNRRKNGEVYVEWLSVTRVVDEAGAVNHVATFADITRRKEAEELLRYRAHHDPLTDLPNRALFQDRLLATLAAARRYERRFALLTIDLDHFKDVNDSLGHGAGDALLIEVGRRLSTCLRESDTVARFGGDEFAIILNEIDDESEVERVVRRALALMAELFQLKEGVVRISGSVGVAIYPDHGTDAQQLHRNADVALYAVKRAGRNGFRIYDPALRSGRNGEAI